MTSGYRAALLVVMMGAGMHFRGLAQHADTVRVDQDTDSTSSVVDSSLSGTESTVGNNQTAAAVQPEPVTLRVIPDTTVAGWKKDEAYAYANDPAYWRQEEGLGKRHDNSYEDPGAGSRLPEYFLLFFCGAVLVFAIVKIVTQNNLRFFYRAAKRQPTANPGEDPGALEDSLEGRLQHYLETSDYRQAVRYLFLKSLRLLNDRGLIRYHQEATNHEYWRQLSQTPQAAPFRDLTLIYEKVWYGEFPLAAQPFEQVHQYFENFYKTVNA
jgi:hypothetical protein